MYMLFFWFFVVTQPEVFGASNEAKEIKVYFLKTFPLNNPSETYKFYDTLAFCPPHKLNNPWLMSLRRVLDGDRMQSAPFSFKMNKDVDSGWVCKRAFTSKDLEKLKNIDNYVAEIEVNELSAFVHLTHKDPLAADQVIRSLDFVLGVNNDEVVSVDVSATYQAISPEMSFGYSVKFVPSSTSVEEAQETQELRQLQLLGVRTTARVPKSVHWLGVANALVLAVLITSMMTAAIVRSVRSDLSQLPGDEESLEEDPVAWKLLHGDVFRAPVHRMVLAAALGAGLQLVLIVSFILLLGALGVVDEESVPAFSVVFYLISSFIAGMEATKWYIRMNGQKWAWCVVMTALFFIGPVFATFVILNSIALAYHSTAAFPFTTIFWLFAVWTLVTLPLTVFGAVAGRKMARNKFFPCKTNKIPREVPKLNWYERKWVVFTVTSLLAFSAIYVELHFLVSTIWSVGSGSVMYSALLITTVLAALILSAAAVLFTYYTLTAENHRWQWRAYFAGASFGVLFMLYSAVFFLKSEMTGFLQGAFFFLYSGLAAFALALMLGYVSFASTMKFVVYIYSRVKVD